MQGVGLHSGAPCAVELTPAPVDHGWWINGTPVREAPRLSAAWATRLQTARGPVSTVEHLLAALIIAQIDDVAIEILGGEAPGLDGCAAPWLAAWRVVPHGGQRRNWVLKRPIEIVDGPRRLYAEPADALSLSVVVEHLPVAPWRCEVDHLATVANARTYGFLRDAPRLHAAGLALGAGWHNTAVLDDAGACLNPGGFRCPNEPARHKALDLLGDLALLGVPLLAKITAIRPGHALNQRLLAAIEANGVEQT